MNQQNLIETFFYMLGQFAFDKAKTYIEIKKESLCKSSPSSPQPPFVSLLSTFAQLAEAEKFYHNQPFVVNSHISFVPSRNFLRRERSLKDVYDDIRLDLQKIEARPKQERLQAEIDKKFSIKTPTAPTIDDGSMTINNQKASHNAAQSVGSSYPGQQASSSSISMTTNFIDRSGSASPRQPRSSTTENMINRSPNKFSTLSPLSWFYNGFKPKTPTSPANKMRTNQPKTPSSVSRRLFHDSTNTSNETPLGKSKSVYALHHGDSTTITDYSSIQNITDNGASIQSPYHLLADQTSSRQVLSPVASTSNANVLPPPPNSAAMTPVTPVIVADFSEELMSHFCLQLQYYTQARLDLIDIYEKLYDVASKKHLHVDGISLQLSMLCRKYQKYFHHPLLAPIKEGMTLECEALMTLIRAAIDIQHWRFLPSVFDLQEARQKLNYWAANTINKETSKRRFNVKAQPIPRLYDWLCKLREFLVAKFTIYFHGTLYRNLPYNTIKNTYTKLSFDFYQKLSHFQRKVDALFIAMLFDVSNEKDYRGQGYHFPTRSFDRPKGKSTLQTMLVTPADAKTRLDNLLAELFMMVAGQSPTLNEGQFQLFDPSKQLTFFLTKPDPHVVLVVTVEGQKLDREAVIKTYMTEITNQLSGNRMIMSLNNITAKSPHKMLN